MIPQFARMPLFTVGKLLLSHSYLSSSDQRSIRALVAALGYLWPVDEPHGRFMDGLISEETPREPELSLPS